MLKKISLSIVAFFVLFFGFSNMARAFSVEAFDTLAGFETLVKLKGVMADTPSFQLTSPDGRVAEFLVNTTKSSTSVEIPGSFLKKAGAYESEDFSFEVFPGEPSPHSSGIYPSKERASADGKDVLPVTVRLQDEYGNPIAGHEVVLLSSRNDDAILLENDDDQVTNTDGLLHFRVASRRPGQSILTAIDKTGGITLEKRAAVLFAPANYRFRKASFLDSVGGDPKTRFLALTDIPATQPASQQVKKFEITELPAQATMNENLNFKVKAVDDQGFLVTSYRGTLEFSSPTDSNAILPTAYVFEDDDLGEHLFELSLSFKAIGKQKLMVRDSEDSTLKGEKEIEILPARPAADTGVQITQPAPGRYSNAVLEIEGEAPANTNVNIFDNGQQIGVTRASSTGRFSFNTPRLSDGPHVISAESGGSLSEEVSVTIDATSSQVEGLTLDPNPASPGERVNVRLETDAGLSEVSVTFEGVVVDLVESDDDPGTYEGVLTAPQEIGDYALDVSVVDESANEATYPEVETLRVEEGFRSDGNATFRVPSRVEGVRATGGPSAVRLTWRPASDDTGVARYRIYYGIDRVNLSQAATTSDARTEWEVRNLKNGVQYFFQVVGVDTEGNEGDQRSAMVGAVPNGEGGDDFGALEGEYVEYPDYLPEDGPGVGLLFFSPIVAYFIQRIRRKKKLL